MDLAALGRLLETCGDSKDIEGVYPCLSDMVHHGSPVVRKGAIMALFRIGLRGHKKKAILDLLTRRQSIEKFPMVQDALEDVLERLRDDY